MFDITPDDIAKLDDEKLREVVGRLCEAEVRRRGFSASSVTSASRYYMAQSGGSLTTPSAETRVDSMIFRTTASTVGFGHEDQPGAGKESQALS